MNTLGKHAKKFGETIHMPRIEAGLSGGDWSRILPIIETMAYKYNVIVYIYTLT